jgi:hypothetical protein
LIYYLCTRKEREEYLLHGIPFKVFIANKYHWYTTKAEGQLYRDRVDCFMFKRGVTEVFELKLNIMGLTIITPLRIDFNYSYCCIPTPSKMWPL